MALREILVAFGITVDQKPIADAEKKVGDLIGTLKKAAQAAGLVTVALGAKRLFGFIEDTVEAANMVDVFAKRLDISTQQVQEFQAIAGVTGLQMNFFQHAFRTLNFQVSQSRPEFAELSRAAGGVKFNFKDTGELFWQVGEALSSVTDKTRRAYLAQTLLGRSAQQLLPIFSGSKEEIEAFRKKIQEVSEVFSAKFIAKAKATWFETNVMGLMWKKVAGLLTEELLPAFNAVIAVLESLAHWTQGWIKDGSAMNSMIAALITGVLLLDAAFGALVFEVIAVAAPFIFLFGVIEDLVGFLNGADSVIGDWLDAAFGPGAQDKSRAGIQQIWDKIKEFWAWFSATSWGDIWKSFYDATVEWGGKAVDWLKTQIATLGLYLAQQLREALGDTASDLIGIKQPIASGDAAAAQAAAQAPGFNSGDAFAGTSKAEEDALNSVLDGLSAFADKLSNALLGGVKPEGAGEAAAPLTDWSPKMSLGGTPALAPNMTPWAGPSSSAPVSIENNITVQGSATASTAREIADRTGTATVSALGRDRSAIGAGVGLSR